MSTTVNAYATSAPKAPFEKITIDRRDLKPSDVLIDIKFAGICHPDIHTARDGWGGTNYPLVPGHEIAGIVSEVDSEVTKYQVGDRVGVGCMVDSCRECVNCKAGEEQYCLKGNVGTYGGMIDGKPTDGGGWVRPRQGSDEWHMLCRFATVDALAEWEASAERRWWLGSAQGPAEMTRTERRTGIEGWFEAPETVESTVPAAAHRRGGSRRPRSGWRSSRSTCSRR